MRCVLLLLALARLGPSHLLAQQSKKPLYEFVKPNGKPKYLPAYRYMEVHLKDSISEDKSFKQTHWLGGDLLNTTSDSLVISRSEDHRTEAIWGETYEPPVRWQRMDLTISDTLENAYAIALNMVDHVRYQHTINGTGAFITVVSAIGLLVYAPLKAMSFRTGTFDSDKYLRVATPCTIGIGVGLVVMPFTDGFRRLHVKLGPSG